MNALTRNEYAAIIQCLCEGNSVASTSRITGAAKNTILSLLQRAGDACSEYMRENITGLKSTRIELDEMWSFVGHKSKGTTNGEKLVQDPQDGDVWLWKAVCAESKLILGWHVGGRTFENAAAFCRDLPHRFIAAPHVVTDGLKAYELAVGFAFTAPDARHSRLVKMYGKDSKGFERCKGARKVRCFGNPDLSETSTSYVERANLTTRMTNRRFARKTNAHSKIIENHRHMIALGFMNYNYCRKHMTLKQTPAQAAGLTDHTWAIAEIVDVMEAREERIRATAFEAAFAMLEAA